MIKAGQTAKRNGSKLTLPTKILSDPQRGLQKVEAEFSAAVLYRDNPSFQIGEVDRLRQELNQAVSRLGQLPRDLDTKHAGNQILAKQLSDAVARIRAGLKRESQHLRLVDQKSNVIANKSNHIDSLQQLFEENTATIRSLRAEVKDLKLENRRMATQQGSTQEVPAKSATKSKRLPRIQMPSMFPVADKDKAA